jgi:hypothetical protein
LGVGRPGERGLVCACVYVCVCVCPVAQGLVYSWAEGSGCSKGPGGKGL